jgi:hypothetical protein
MHRFSLFQKTPYKCIHATFGCSTLKIVTRAKTSLHTIWHPITYHYFKITYDSLIIVLLHSNHTFLPTKNQ